MRAVRLHLDDELVCFFLAMIRSPDEQDELDKVFGQGPLLVLS